MGIACISSLSQIGRGKKRQPLNFKFIIDRKQQARTCCMCNLTVHGRPKECPCCGSKFMTNARIFNKTQREA